MRNERNYTPRHTHQLRICITEEQRILLEGQSISGEYRSKSDAARGAIAAGLLAQGIDLVSQGLLEAKP